ncbi:MAG: YfiR family protein [Pseudomonadota bacterium]
MRKHFCNLLMGLSLLLASVAGQAQVSTEQQLKAAYLVNFLKYVEWPESHAKATICLFGREALGNALVSYEGRSVGGRPIELRRVSSPDQLADCRILYVPDTEEARFAAVLRWVEGLPILTVSDAEFFARQGGGIALVREDTRLGFDVNLNTLNRARLKPASQMMRLARQVIGGAH